MQARDQRGERAYAPHCDQSILHGPGTCWACDQYPDWQHVREVQRIAFSDQEATGDLAPCPSTWFRQPDLRDAWGGNRAQPAPTAASSSLTTDPADPRLGRGVDTSPVEQHDVYLVLSDEERAKGFTRPLRRKYVHHYWLDGRNEPLPAVLITLDGIGGCGALTTMGLALCETYARDPKFYGATFCAGCRMHRPVGEFRWDEDGQVVGS